jgi:hypothetical protein
MTLDSEYADWLKIPKGTLTHQILPFPKYAEAYHHQLWPAGKPYVSPLNPIFLLQCAQLTQLNQRERWLIRDGVLPLVHFFRANPKPIGLHAKIYLQESLAWTTPRAWRDQVGTYKVVSQEPQGPVKKLVICGIGLHGFHSEIELKEQLAALNRPRIHAMSSEVCLPMKPVEFGRQDFHCEYLSTLSLWLGKKYRSVLWTELALKSEFKGYEFLELSARRLCADSYYTHVVLSKGAYLHDLSPRSDTAHYVPLSPFHGYLIEEKIPLRLEVPKVPPVCVVGEGDFPWHTWFKKWNRSN